uniref:DUF4283 domain-containing protein n=1 Tax=Populus alba TaxID=43335 RepID=A0A4U5Q7F6_POPAL|nr:hypothetical protein D5086_0000143660 [Populus alba]
MTTANGFMIFRFNTEEKMQAVLEKGPWMFGGKNIILQQWHPRFQFDKNKISTLPVWIRLHGLPFPLWSKQGLSLAASMLEIESPLSTAPITVTVEYEWKPQSCDKCKVFGHNCYKPPPIVLDKGKSHVDSVLPAHSSHPKTISPIAVDKDQAQLALCAITAYNCPIDKTITLLFASPIIEPEAVQDKASKTIGYISQDRYPSGKILSSNGNGSCTLKLHPRRKSLSLPPSHNQAQQQIRSSIRQGPILGLIPEEEDGGSDQDSACDPLSIEESQHLITGFANCVESRMASIESGSESSTSTAGNLLDISSLNQGIPPPPSPKSKKKKGKKQRKALGPFTIL